MALRFYLACFLICLSSLPSCTCSTRLEYDSGDDQSLTPKYGFSCRTSSFGPQREIIHRENSSLELDCWTSNTIRENHTIRWTHESKLLLSDTSTNSSLHLENVSSAHGGIYVCTIWFLQTLVKYEQQFQLTINGRPKPPVNLEITEFGLSASGQDSVKLSWKEPRTVVWDYIIKYKNDEGAEVSHSNGAYERTITLTLPARKRYSIEICAKNEFGLSEEAAKISFVTRGSDQRGYDYRLVRVENSTLRLDCAGYDMHYDTVWSFRASLDDSTKNESHILKNCTKGHEECPLVIDRLAKEQEGYYICSASTPGISMKIVTRLVFLQPPRPMNSATCHVVNDDRYYVQLRDESRSVEIPEEYRIEQYRVAYKELGSADGWMQETAPGDRTGFHIEHRREDSVYIFKIVAINGAGESPQVIGLCEIRD